MACSSIETGDRFLSGVIGHIDCQAQTIGSYGFGALSATGSPGFVALTVVLTIFVAILGIRIMFGAEARGRDLVGDILRVGIVLTLATSWPAWRTLGYNLVLNGPGEVASQIGLGAGLPGSQGDLNSRLQAVDDGIVVLTIYGTGRLGGGVVSGDNLGDQPRGVALGDSAGLAWGRIAFLVGAIAPLGVVRLGAGLLLALAPVMAALLLFAGTRDLFFGWLRALAACGLGALVLMVAQSTQLALLEPWLESTLRQRQAAALTLAAPTELTVIAFSFAAICLGLLALTVRIAFFGQPSLVRSWAQAEGQTRSHTERADFSGIEGSRRHEPPQDRSRAERLADAVALTVRREEFASGGRFDRLAIASAQPGSRSDASTSGTLSAAAPERLGSSYRRSQLRRSRAGQLRDQSS